MLVKRCWGASSEQSPGGSSHSTAFGVLHPSTPSVSLRDNQASPLAVPSDFSVCLIQKSSLHSPTVCSAGFAQHQRGVGFFVVVFEFAAGNLSWIQTGDLNVKGSIARY